MNFQGTDYAVSDQVFQQFKAGYEQAQKNGSRRKQQQSLSSLGLDPRQWLTNPKNEGDAKVGDDDTIKITGGVDVNKLLDDVNTALAEGQALGVQGTQNLPEPADRRAEASRSPTRSRTRRSRSTPARTTRSCAAWWSRSASSTPKGSSTTGSANVNFDLSISDLNEDQTISEPSGAKPFDQLLSQLGGLGLGGLGATGGTGSTGGRRAAAAAARRTTRSSRSTRSASPTPAATSPRRASAPSCSPASPMRLIVCWSTSGGGGHHACGSAHAALARRATTRRSRRPTRRASSRRAPPHVGAQGGDPPHRQDRRAGPDPRRRHDRRRRAGDRRLGAANPAQAGAPSPKPAA